MLPLAGSVRVVSGGRVVAVGSSGRLARVLAHRHLRLQPRQQDVDLLLAIPTEADGEPHVADVVGAQRPIGGYRDITAVGVRLCHRHTAAGRDDERRRQHERDDDAQEPRHASMVPWIDIDQEDGWTCAWELWSSPRASTPSWRSSTGHPTRSTTTAPRTASRRHSTASTKSSLKEPTSSTSAA